MGKVLETVADSIAIEILDKTTIITGKGNELHLFTRNVTKENVVEEQVLDIKLHNKIHGIKKGEHSNDGVLLVYGEKEFILLEYNKNFEFQELYRAELTDWISSALLLNVTEKQQEFVILTAHSIVLLFNYNVETKTCSLKERISCTDKSTLYCAHLYGSIWSELIVFAGNAFGELLIWQPSCHKLDKDASKPKQSLLLHRISAHNGVIFSIDYNHEARYLITTSDDRAVKWWKVKFSNDAGKENSWNDSSLQAMASGYGHVARVFQGRIINEGPNIYALSVGEDSYFCLWQNNGELLFKRRQQYGATIWNFVYDENTKTIYTIGSIGNLIAYDLKQILHETQHPQNDKLLPQVMAEDPAEYIAKVKFLNETQLIGITNQNRLMATKVVEDKDDKWDSIDIELKFKCTVMEVFDNLTAICGFKHWMLIEWQEESDEFVKLYDAEVLKGVLRAFVFLSKYQYLLCDDKGNCLIVTDSKAEKQKFIELPKCKEPWLTTALLINQEQQLVISNRQGNLLLYKLSEDRINYKLQDTIKHPHGNLGATNLQCLATHENCTIIRSSGHDGAINLFSINLNDSTIKTCSRQIIPVAWVEHIEKWYGNLDLYLGFNDNHFVTWNREYDFLLQIPCGGGHRCWHFKINPHDFYISLVFIKNKRVRYYKLPLVNQELIKLPLAKRWHVAPCNIMEILETQGNASTIAITAGDDNLIKLHTLTNRGLKEVKELHNHISNIRALRVLAINSQEFLIFSGGGRAQLCITKVNNVTFHIEELINYTLKADNKENKSNKSFNFDPETRLMSLDVKALKNNEYHIFIGCSDGFIRKLSFNLSTLHIDLLTQYFYNKCILQIKYIPHKDLVLVAATDGLLKFFDADLNNCIFELSHHASGINGLSVNFNSTTKTLQILTGGDDQAVSYSLISLDEFKILTSFHKPYLHTAQVCATALSSNGLYGFTSGVDQNLYKMDLSTGEVLDSFHSCVADIKGVALVNDNICLLYGCGLQIYAFNS